MRKGQAAMEFLMTYGWAILVVLAAIGALAYFGVLSPSKFLPEKCSFPAGMDCIGKATISATGSKVTFVLGNNNGATINITTLAASGTGTCGTSNTPQACAGVGCTLAAVPANSVLNITNNDKVTFGLTCGSALVANQKFKDTITVTYINVDTGLTQKASGDIIGSIVP